MKLIKQSFMLSLALTSLLTSNTRAVPAPAYLRDLDITIKAASEDETTKLSKKLSKKTLIAIKSLKNGAYIYVKDENGNKIATTVRSDGSATFLVFTYTTPLETHFYATKTSDKSTIVWLKSPAMEGQVLTVKPDNSDITFKKFDKSDESQQWAIECADGLDQVYFKNKKTNMYLGLDDDGKLICQAKETSKAELFKVVVLD